MPPRFAISLVVIGMLAAACVPAEKEENLGKRWDETTVMGELQREGTMRVAVSPDSPTRVEGAEGAYDAFVMEFARYLADTLGVELDVVEVPISQLQTGIDSGDVDLAFPITPITEESVREQAFSDPLFVSHQRLLAADDTPDLAGRTVCSLVDEEAGLDLSQSLAVTARRERDPAVCAAGLITGEFAAATAPEIVLLAVRDLMDTLGCQEKPNVECVTLTNLGIVGDQLSTGGLGAQLKTGAQAWVDYVNLVLDKWIEDGGWAAAYAENFEDEVEPPDLTVEEAAALFPSD